MADLWRRPPTLWISVAKGSLAVTLAMLLVFVRAFDELIAHPVALNGVSKPTPLRPLAPRITNDRPRCR